MSETVTEQDCDGDEACVSFSSLIVECGQLQYFLLHLYIGVQKNKLIYSLLFIKLLFCGLISVHERLSVKIVAKHFPPVIYDGKNMNDVISD